MIAISVEYAAFIVAIVAAAVALYLYGRKHERWSHARRYVDDHPAVPQANDLRP